MIKLEKYKNGYRVKGTEIFLVYDRDSGWWAGVGDPYINDDAIETLHCFEAKFKAKHVAIRFLEQVEEQLTRSGTK